LSDVLMKYPATNASLLTLLFIYHGRCVYMWRTV